MLYNVKLLLGLMNSYSLFLNSDSLFKNEPEDWRLSDRVKSWDPSDLKTLVKFMVKLTKKCFASENWFKCAMMWADCGCWLIWSPTVQCVVVQNDVYVLSHCAMVAVVAGLSSISRSGWRAMTALSSAVILLSLTDTYKITLTQNKTTMMKFLHFKTQIWCYKHEAKLEYLTEYI